MPGHYNMSNNRGLLKDSLMPPAETRRKQEPQPIDPPKEAVKPVVLDSSTDEGNGGSSAGTTNQGMDNDTMILIGLGALLLFSYGMVR